MGGPTIGIKSQIFLKKYEYNEANRTWLYAKLLEKDVWAASQLDLAMGNLILVICVENNFDMMIKEAGSIVKQSLNKLISNPNLNWYEAF